MHRVQSRIREQISYDKLQFDRSKGALSFITTMLRWAIVISVVMWVVMGLVSLRFDLSGNFLDIFYSQLIVAGIMVAAIANTYVSNMGGFGGSRGYGAYIWAPLLSGIASCLGLLLLLWYVWTDFTVGPNELMKTTYSFLGVGSCGTIAGFVTLASVARIFRALQWATYVLTAVVAVETLDALWSVETLSLASAGREFAIVGIVAGITFAGYSVVALIARDASSEKARVANLYIYLALGLFGYGASLVYLWQALDAGPVRFVYGAAIVLTIVAIALALLHHYKSRPIDRFAQPETHNSPESEPVTYRPPGGEDQS